MITVKNHIRNDKNELQIRFNSIRFYNNISYNNDILFKKGIFKQKECKKRFNYRLGGSDSIRSSLLLIFK